MSSHQPRLSYSDFQGLAPKAVQGLSGLSSAAHGVLEDSLVELLKLRASQINGCAFCIQHHLTIARKAGLSSTKMDLVAAWRDAGVFSPREMAALAWTEQLTDLSRQGAPDAAWEALRAEFSEAEAVALCAAIASINAWNRIAVALRFAPMVAASTPT